MDKDRVEGTLREGQGKIKEEIGDVADDRSTELGGKADQAQGEVQQRWGEAKDKIGDWSDDQGEKS